jgi:hypothetical protein
MRHQRILFWLVLLIGIGFRLALAFARSDDLLADNDGYLAHARGISEGTGFLGPYSGVPTAFRPPAYPVALGLLQACGMGPAVAVMFINLVASICILVFTRKLAEQCGLSPGFALLSMVCVALDPLLLRYSVLPMTEVPCAAVLLAAVVLFRVAQTQSRRAWIIAIGSGILFGVGALVRPVILVSCGFMSLAALVKKRHVAVILPAVVAGLVMIPWVIRNAVQFQKFIPATTHGGYTLALGNNPVFYKDVINGTDTFPWDGAALDVWQQQMIAESQQDVRPPANEPAMDRWYYKKATDAIKADPASFLKASFLRLQRFWALTTADSKVHNRATPGVSVWYGLLWCGLVMERVSAWRRGKTLQTAPVGDLWLAVLSFMLMHTVYWTDTRMRAPLMPILIVLSCCGWQMIMQRISVLRQSGRRV